MSTHDFNSYGIQFYSDLDEAIVQGIGLLQAIFAEHFPNNRLSAVAYGEQQRLVGHILAEALAVDFQCAARVGSAVA